MSKKFISSLASHPFVIRCMKCKYPNIAAEVVTHNAGHPDTYSEHANVSKEILQQFLEGKEDLTPSEIQEITNLSRSRTNVHYSSSYLCCKRLSYYDLSKPKHYRKVLVIYNNAQKAISQCKCEGDIAIADTILPFEIVKSNGFVTRASINYVLRFIESVELSNQIYARKSQRRKVS